MSERYYNENGVTEEGLKALAAKFHESQIEWKIQTITKDEKKAMVVPYIDARAVQNRFDSVCGAQNWRNHLTPVKAIANGQEVINMLHGISVRIADLDGDWLTKWDGSNPSSIESFKGVISTSERRAAVQWGPGRDIYGLETEWVTLIDGKDGKCKGSFKSKLENRTKFVTFNPPKLPEGYRDDNGEGGKPHTVAGFSGTYEQILESMKEKMRADNMVSTVNGSPLIKVVEEYEGQMETDRLVMMLAKYFEEEA